MNTTNGQENGVASTCILKQTAQEKSSEMSPTSSISLSTAEPKMKRLRLSLSKQAETDTTKIPFSDQKVKCKQSTPVITTYKSILHQKDMNANQFQARIDTSSKKSFLTMLRPPLDNTESHTKQGKQQNQSNTNFSIGKIHQNKLRHSKEPKSKQTPSNPSLFECTACKKTYGLRQNLQKHIRRKHPEQSVSHCNIACNEDNCNFTCRFLSQLRYHLQEGHGIIMDNENKTFETQEG